MTNEVAYVRTARDMDPLKAAYEHMLCISSKEEGFDLWWPSGYDVLAHNPAALSPLLDKQSYRPCPTPCKARSAVFQTASAASTGSLPTFAYRHRMS